MSVTIKQSVIDMLAQTVGQGEAEAALRELMMLNIDDMDTFMEFLEALDKADGDMSRIVGMTHEPVPIEQFLDDSYFLGDAFVLYPEVRQAIIDIINGGYVQAILTGATGIGKTSIAQIIQARYVYEISCERFPQARFGLTPTSDIVFAMLNRTSDLAKDVTYGGFHNMLMEVPYFREEYPFDHSVKSRMEFPRNIKVEYAAANANKLLGKNIFSGITDEMNFQDRIEKSKRSLTGGYFDQAVSIHRTFIRRQKSRFLLHGRLPGCLCVVSSANYEGDFTDRLVKDVEAENDGLTYIYDKSQWAVLPGNRYSGVTFPLDVGSERRTPRILEKKEDAPDGATVLDVPIEYKDDFKRDMVGALADIAGLRVTASHPYFYDKDKIWQMCDFFRNEEFRTPFTVEDTDFSDGFPEFKHGFKIPKATISRSIHIDLGVTGDACGFAMGFVDKISSVPSRITGSTVVEDVPHVTYDILLQIKRRKNQEIEFSEVRDFIYYLAKKGYPIKWVTFDSFQSVDARQILRRKGFISEVLSVEGIDAYEALRTAIFQDRIAAPENHICFNELARLEEDREKRRVDHLKGQSKDVADAMCGVYANLLRRRESWRDRGGPTIRIEHDGETRDVRTPETSGRRDITRRDIVRR